MPSDEVHAIEGLSQRVRTLSNRTIRLTTLRDQVQDDLTVKQAEVATLSQRIELLVKVGELFRTLMDLMVVKQVRVVEEIVTEGLQSIFHDLDLSFESDIVPRYNKIAVDFYIRQGQKDDPLSFRGRPMESFGGGPSSVASLVLRVLTVLRLKLWPVLILDEALGAVSDEYTDQTALFLRTLAQKLGVDILLVTHKQAFLDHANVAYRCSEVVEEDGSTRRLSLRSIK